MTDTPTLRVVTESDDDVEALIRQTLEQMNTTYTTLNRVVSQLDEPCAARALSNMLIGARDANEQMLAFMRHPSGGR